MKNKYSTYEKWLVAANARMKRMWAIDFHEAGADEEELRQYYADHLENQTDVETLSREYGEKHDLIQFEEDILSMFEGFRVPEPDATFGGPDPETNYLDSYPQIEVDAALCVWEYMLERDKRIYKGPREDDDASIRITQGFEDYGSAQMRCSSIPIGRYVHRVWVAFEETYGEDSFSLSFDWDFVPAVISRLPIAEVLRSMAFENSYVWPDVPTMVQELGAVYARR